MDTIKQPIVLEVNNLRKKIGDKWIIRDISFQVFVGEIFGFLGPNGSGKTTTIRMLVDLIKPTSGTVTICGKDVTKEHDAALQYVGSIVENPEMYTYLTGWENLEQFARMMPGVTLTRIQEVVAIVGMEQRIHDKVKTYSLGMRQRLGIAQALLGKPKLLILDEPTNGLDPQGIKELREFIRRLADEGMSLFISSHLLSEIQSMCDRVAIISHGELLAVGSVEDLIQSDYSTVTWKLHPLEKAMNVLENHQGVRIIQTIDTGQAIENAASSPSVSIITELNQEWIPLLNEQMVTMGVRIYAIQIKNPSLEDLFLSVTEGGTID